MGHVMGLNWYIQLNWQMRWVGLYCVVYLFLGSFLMPLRWDRSDDVLQGLRWLFHHSDDRLKIFVGVDVDHDGTCGLVDGVTVGTCTFLVAFCFGGAATRRSDSIYGTVSWILRNWWFFAFCSLTTFMRLVHFFIFLIVYFRRFNLVQVNCFWRRSRELRFKNLDLWGEWLSLLFLNEEQLVLVVNKVDLKFVFFDFVHDLLLVCRQIFVIVWLLCGRKSENLRRLESCHFCLRWSLAKLLLVVGVRVF